MSKCTILIIEDEKNILSFMGKYSGSTGTAS